MPFLACHWGNLTDFPSNEKDDTYPAKKPRMTVELTQLIPPYAVPTTTKTSVSTASYVF
jgi:hypothetical protein